MTSLNAFILKFQIISIIIRSLLWFLNEHMIGADMSQMTFKPCTTLDRETAEGTNI